MADLDTGDFFDLLFGDAPEEGYVTLATYPGGVYDPSPKVGPTNQMWFRWPDQRADMIATAKMNRTSDLYVCPILFRYGPEQLGPDDGEGNRPKIGGRKPQNVKWLGYVFADADTAPPDVFKLKPTITVETSPSRYHLYWKVTDADGDVRRLTRSGRAMAYAHKADGCDTGGWDMTQLLRVPGTTNNKPSNKGAWTVSARSADVAYTLSEVETAYPADKQPAPAVGKADSGTVPAEMPDYSLTYAKISRFPRMIDLLNAKGRAPSPGREGNRSALFWKLCVWLAQAGLTREEAFVLAWPVHYNKFRDRPDARQVVWKQVCDAFEQAQMDPAPAAQDTKAQDLRDRSVNLLTRSEREAVPMTWIDRYKAWGSTKTDAAASFHEAAAWTVASAVMGEFGKPATKFDSGNLNLWFMVLGGTTLSRKTTVRKMMKRTLRLAQTDGYEYELGGDVTPEALSEFLLDRPGHSVVLDKDEVYGMQETAKKTYLAGLQPLLTELYDGVVPGRLRVGNATQAKGGETNFLMYLTGATQSVIESYTPKDFASGHLARFLFVHAEQLEMSEERLYIEQAEEPKEDSAAQLSWGTDVDHVQRHLVTELEKARTYWSGRVKRGKQRMVYWEPDAWKRFNEIQAKAVMWAYEHQHKDALVPTTQRAVISLLRMATILAMLECAPRVQMGHLLRAALFFEEALTHTTVVLTKLNKTSRSNALDAVRDRIEAAGSRGITWDALYRHFRDRYHRTVMKDYVADLVSAGEVYVEGRNIRIGGKETM